MAGEICWLEVNTTDADGAKGFYGALFGWEKGPGDVGFPYHFLRRPGESANFGGVMPLQAGSPAPPHWLVYFAVPDLGAAVRKVEELGGRVHVPLVTLPQGRFAVVSDPQGAAFAVYEAAK